MAMKVRLLINLYPSADRERLEEIKSCLEINLANRFIHRVTVLDEGFPDRELLAHPKIDLRPIQSRPAFRDFYEALDPDGFNLLSNNDIAFDSTLGALRLLRPGPYDLLVLSRREADGKLFRENKGDSQDSWLFHGRAAPLKECPFTMGVPGCENRLAFLFFRNRYRVLNPARCIRAQHLHASNARPYKPTDRLAGDYLSTRPVGLLGFHFFRLLLKLLQARKILIVKTLDPR